MRPNPALNRFGWGMNALLIAPAVTGASAVGEVVSSPDGRISIRIETDAGHFSVSRNGETVVARSPLGLELDGVAEMGAPALEKREDLKVDRTIPLEATRTASAADRYHSATFIFREPTRAARRLFIDVRAYDDDVAFLYQIEDSVPVHLRGEKTAFTFPDDPGRSRLHRRTRERGPRAEF